MDHGAPVGDLKLIHKPKVQTMFTTAATYTVFYFTLMDEMCIFSHKISHLCVIDKPGLLFSAENCNCRHTTCHAGVSCFLLPNDTHEWLMCCQKSTLLPSNHLSPDVCLIVVVCFLFYSRSHNRLSYSKYV